MIDIKQPYIQVDSINKSFGRSRVLHDISFSVMQNQVTIIRGMNGSGKSTLLSILSTHISPDSGTVFYKGVDSKKNLHNIRNSLGILDHLPMLYERLTVKENLEFFAKVYSISNETQRLKTRKSNSLINFTSLDTQLDLQVARLVEIYPVLHFVLKFNNSSAPYNFLLDLQSNF